jgi:heme O synthase-like polyprenyltransferase
MSVSAVLFLAWIVVMTFWMVNHFYRQNQKYEMEYRQGKHPRWEKPDDYDEN